MKNPRIFPNRKSLQFCPQAKRRNKKKQERKNKKKKHNNNKRKRNKHNQNKKHNILKPKRKNKSKPHSEYVFHDSDIDPYEQMMNYHGDGVPYGWEEVSMEEVIFVEDLKAIQPDKQNHFWKLFPYTYSDNKCNVYNLCGVDINALCKSPNNL
eukprot:233317_1